MVGLIVVSAVITVRADEASFFGTWKYNPAKSDLGPIEMTIAQVGDELQLTDQSKKSYKFKLDGKPYKDAYGYLVTWRQVKPNEWELTYELNGNNVGVERYVLSADGKTLNDTSRMVGGGAQDVEQKTTLHRSGTGTGLVGKWAGGKIEMSPFTMEIVQQGNDGLIFRVPGAFEAKAQFDGKPYPMTGAMTPSGSTASFTRVDARSFRTKQRQPNGTALDATVTVSADGGTLTEEGTDEAGIKRTWVFNRQ
jgi:hypothetical protein